MCPLEQWKKGAIKATVFRNKSNKAANWRPTLPSLQLGPHVNGSCGFDSSALPLWLLSAWITFPWRSLARGLSPPPEVLPVKCQSEERGLKSGRRTLVWFVRERPARPLAHKTHENQLLLKDVDVHLKSGLKANRRGGNISHAAARASSAEIPTNRVSAD